MWPILEKYGNAVYQRAFLRRELRRLARKGVAVPGWLAKRAVWHPSAAEDLVNFLRFLKPDQPVFLIDIGANRGEWAADFLALFPDTAVIAVEPVPATFARLKQRFEGDRRVRPVNTAISERGGTMVMQSGTDDTLASFHDYAVVFTDSRDQTGRVAIDVPVCRLDDLTIDGTEGRTGVLKIDVQGHEAAVLAGGPEVIQKIDIAIVELSFVEEYVGLPPSFAACTGLLAAAGLYPVIFQDYGRIKGPYAAERDVIFVRRHLLSRVIG